jgi:exopolyphosphatase/guanosine-5'-triphosphate,3'-diphosphate pyrophosphatase
MRLAAIDIGSNSIKLIVVEAATEDSFAVLGREKEVVRLGHNTLKAGFLEAEAIMRAAETIRRYRSIAESRGAERVAAIATASVREAWNAQEFVREVERHAGLRVEILSGLEEARLIGLAAVHECAAQGTTLLNIDIGGGSTELSLMERGEPAALHSVKLGCVGTTERFIANDPIKTKELKNLREEIRAVWERPAREMRGSKWKLTSGTSGTALALGRMALLEKLKPEQLNAQPAQPAGQIFTLDWLAKFNERAAKATVAQRREWAGMSAQRAEVILAGGNIMEGFMRVFGVKSVRACDYALREGVILDSLREMEAEARPPLADEADPRLRSVHAVGRRFGYEETHAHQVARLAEKIFDALAPIHKLSRHQRTLLAVAALLHDAGYHIAHEDHHKHALYLIKNSELTGFSEAERLVIANIARYHRGSLPKDRHPDFAALAPADQKTVWQLGAILRLADALDAGYESHVTDIKCAARNRRVNIILHSPHRCENELRALQLKRDMFETAFNCKLIAVRERREDGLRFKVQSSSPNA